MEGVDSFNLLRSILATSGVPDLKLPEELKLFFKDPPANFSILFMFYLLPRTRAYVFENFIYFLLVVVNFLNFICADGLGGTPSFIFPSFSLKLALGAKLRLCGVSEDAASLAEEVLRGLVVSEALIGEMESIESVGW